MGEISAYPRAALDYPWTAPDSPHGLQCANCSLVMLQQTMGSQFPCFLFFQPIFQSRLLLRFAEAICRTLFDQNQPLLTDDLTETLALMVCNPTDEQNLAACQFAQELLPRLLVAAPPEGFGLDSSQAEAALGQLVLAKDLPSFCSDFAQLVAEVSLYRLCRQFTN